MLIVATKVKNQEMRFLTLFEISFSYESANF